MSIGYIFLSDRARWWEKLLNIILTTKLEENYIYELSNTSKNCIKRLNKKMSKNNVKQIICEKKIEEYIKTDKQQVSKKCIMNYMLLEILKYVFKNQGKEMEPEDIYFLINKDEEIYLKNIIVLSKIFKTTNIVTEDINKFEKITETLFNEDETVISISNNKKKSLRRAKYIVNFDFDTEKLIQYSINRTAVIINVNNDMKIENIAFEGICINNINIEIPNEIEKYFDILTEKIDKTTLYVSLLNRKQELERIRTRIKDDNIHILDLIGYNGTIDQKQLVRIS